ncbi:MAG: hypothetical protein OD811_01845 [Alphaproteobacteria bacterium]
MRSFVMMARRRGVTFIELIGVLVVAIIIIAGALALYSEANTSSRTNQLIVAVGALSGSVRALHANTASYGGTASPVAAADLVSVLVSANSVPPGMLVTGTGATARISHAFTGPVVVGGIEQNFMVAAGDLDEDICIRLSTESTAKASSGLRGVFIKSDNTAPSSSNGWGLSTVAGEAVNIIDFSNGTGTHAATVAGTGYFIYSSASGATSASSLNIPIAPAAAELACAASDNYIGWVYQ